jgi:hypothetical protein
MNRDGIHPLDRRKLRSIAERLFGVSDGTLATRAGLAPLIGELMMCVRDDCCPAGEDAVLERVLAQVDHRLGVEAIADLVLAEVVLQ